MCAHRAQATLRDELAAAPATPAVAELQLCGQPALRALRNAAERLGHDPPTDRHICVQLDRFIIRGYKHMNASCWRRLWSDICILRSVADVNEAKRTGDDILAMLAIARLDHCIVVAGAPGKGRLDLITSFIREIQTECLRCVHPDPSSIHSAPPPPHRPAAPLPTLATSSKFVPRLDTLPSLASFMSRHSREPFILPGYALDWPAMNQHPWRSLDYLRAIAGPGRVVPVEVGSDYRADDWQPKMMSFNDFLKTLDPAAQPQDDRPIVYLAQHNLFAQFPELRADILVPDYVYAALPPPEDYPAYAPPRNAAQLVLNTWLGPAGAVSPAHTDPYFNFYAQVVGRKTVWLAPPHATPAMYPYPPPAAAPTDWTLPEDEDDDAALLPSLDSAVAHAELFAPGTSIYPYPQPQSALASQPRNPAQNTIAPSMTNTSQVDVFAASSAAERARFPQFWAGAVGEAMHATLEPGDVLFFPPGWWHAMRTEETSFSVSMWF